MAETPGSLLSKFLQEKDPEKRKKLRDRFEQKTNDYFESQGVKATITHVSQEEADKSSVPKRRLRKRRP